MRLAVLREDIGDGHVLALFDQIVDIDVLPSRDACASARASVVLPAAMKPTRYTLSPSRDVSRSSVSKKPGYEMADGLGAVDRRRPRGAERGDRERHGDPMIVVGVGDAARGVPEPWTVKPSGRSSAGDSEIAEPGDERRNPIAFLDAELGGAAHGHLAADAPRARRSAGSSSISPGTSSGGISTLRLSVAFDQDRSAGLARRPVRRSTLTLAPNRRSTSMSAVRVGFSPTSSTSIRDPGRAAAATIQKAADEKSPGTDRFRASSRGAACDRDARTATCDTGAKASKRPFGVVAGFRRLGHRCHAVCMESCQQHRRLHLSARHWRPVGDRPQGPAVDDQRRVAVVGFDTRRPSVRAVR